MIGIKDLEKIVSSSCLLLKCIPQIHTPAFTNLSQNVMEDDMELIKLDFHDKINHKI